MFQVFENDKPADINFFPEFCLVGNGCWDCSEFETLEKAQDYAMAWLDIYAPLNPTELKLETPYYYGGLGAFVVIKEV